MFGSLKSLTNLNSLGDTEHTNISITNVWQNQLSYIFVCWLTTDDEMDEKRVRFHNEQTHTQHNTTQHIIQYKCNSARVHTHTLTIIHNSPEKEQQKWFHIVECMIQQIHKRMSHNNAMPECLLLCNARQRIESIQHLSDKGHLRWHDWNAPNRMHVKRSA